ncbi:MAG: GTPase-activating protein [Desulfuromonadaceae bacterium]|nr:GTPase-activating protein [Desulfuromonadaceae bacterium]
MFEAGKLVSVLVEGENGKRQAGFEALSALAELMVTTGSGTLNVYKLSKDLTMCIHALLEGEMLYKAQELNLIDIKTLLEKVKQDQMNGCLRIYTDDHSAMIFYKGGNPLGFFHDGSSDIETSSSESQKIAGLPGAKIDLFSTQSAEELMGTDLLEVANVQKIWETCISIHNSEIEKANLKRQDRDNKLVSQNLAELEEQVKLIVVEYVGKLGFGIVDKEISENGGNTFLLDVEGAEKFIKNIERAAKLLVSGSSIKLMKEKLSSAISVAKSEI